MLLERANVVTVYMRVTELDDELVRLGLREVRDEVREECVGGDVEGDAEAEVCGALVEEAREPFGGGGRGGRREVHVELAEDVARREGHQRDVYEEGQDRRGCRSARVKR